MSRLTATVPTFACSLQSKLTMTGRENLHMVARLLAALAGLPQGSVRSSPYV